MMTRTSDRWWTAYCRWGGQSFLVDPSGWNEGNWKDSWFKERITADEFFKRLNSSVTIFFPSERYETLSDAEEYFVVICHEEDD